MIYNKEATIICFIFVLLCFASFIKKEVSLVQTSLLQQFFLGVLAKASMYVKKNIILL
jgi:hypothetical protein